MSERVEDLEKRIEQLRNDLRCAIKCDSASVKDIVSDLVSAVIKYECIEED